MLVNILVEGATDEPVARRLLDYVDLESGVVYGGKGKKHVLERVIAYNKAAKITPWFVLIDLDTDSQCPSESLGLWLPQPAHGMRFRIAVRAVEAWLMADRESIANFLSVSLAKVPHQVELDPHPKQTFINLARASRNKSIREDIVPRDGSGAKVGPLYVARFTDFAMHHWRPEEGAKHSKSLQRCINALSTLKNFRIES